MKKVIEISGMSCEHCKARVEKVLRAIEGVASAVVDLKNNKADVELNADIENSVFKNVIEDAGYEVISIK